MKKPDTIGDDNNIDKSTLKKKVKEMEDKLGINTSFKNIPLYLILSGWFCVISTIRPLLIAGILLAGVAFILSFNNRYKDAYQWNKAITLYFLDDIEKAKSHLEKLSASQKESEAYEKMLKFLV